MARHALLVLGLFAMLALIAGASPQDQEEAMAPRRMLPAKIKLGRGDDGKGLKFSVDGKARGVAYSYSASLAYNRKGSGESGNSKAEGEASASGDVVKGGVRTRAEKKWAFAGAGAIAFDKPGGAKGVSADTDTDACTNC